MKVVARAGVNQEWLKNWDEVFHENEEILKVHSEENIESLEYYVQHGETKQKKFPTALQVTHQRWKWEDFVDSELANYGLYQIWKFEVSSIEKKEFDLSFANSAFSAIFLSQMIRLFIHFRFPARFNGRKLQLMQLEGIAYSALGIVIGKNDQASKLARLQLLAYRKGFYAKTDFYPIFHFMMKIIADYLSEPPHVPRGEALEDQVFNDLYRVWRLPEAEEIVPFCLAALDSHTNRSVCIEGETHEFEAAWQHTPVEILLMFTLRELSGLSNPAIDHPLMNSPLGVCPKLTNSPQDVLIESVGERMCKDGFNEDEIFVECYGSQKN